MPEPLTRNQLVAWFRRWRVAWSAWQDWREWFNGGYNWRNFTLIAVEYEGIMADAHMPEGRSGELRLGLLGFNLRIEVYDRVDRACGMQPLIARRDEFLSREDKAPDA